MTASEAIGGGSDESAVSSPKNKVKFLCSYGGKILPRLGDANLKYVGGETRVVAVPRDIKFTELMKKINSMVEGDMVLKYQVIPEELDALVTVKSDEDLKHMVDEYRRLESEGSPKLRAFLFPSTPFVLENQMNPIDPFAIEQRYIDAVNGIVHSSSNTSGRLTPINSTSRPNFSISASSSPQSASPDDRKFMDSPPLLNGYLRMPKVKSSPSLCSLGNPYPQNNNNHSNNINHHYQPHHCWHQHHHHQVNSYTIQSPRPFQDFRNEKPIGPPPPHDFGRGFPGHVHVPMNHIYSIGRQNLGNGYNKSGCYYDDGLVYANGGLRRGSP